MNWKDPEQRREYYRRYREAHPGYGAAKMRAYRKGRPAKHVVAGDFKADEFQSDCLTKHKATRVTWDMLEAI